MKYDRLKELREIASEAHHSADYERAGELYTLVAYNQISTGDWVYFEQVMASLFSLQQSCINFRLAGKINRSQNRAKQGILLSEDIRESLAGTTAQRGITFEYEGDFRVMGALEEQDQPYKKAKSLYEEYERETNISERIGQMSENSVHDNTILLRSLVDATGFDIDEDTKTKIEFHSPVARIDFKRESLTSIVDDLIDQGEWWSAIED